MTPQSRASHVICPGLPLATIAVTILFCVLAISSYGINAIGRAYAAGTVADAKDIIPTEFPTAILELSKLLLGAFIGSFVANSATKPVDAPPTKTSAN